MLITSVRPQMVDFGSGQGVINFETAVIAGYFEDSAEGCALRLENRHCVLKRAKTQPWAERCCLWMGTK
ncbi:MAG: hypothetical protein GY702_16800 [Desulfobulbaceae bacterium]|nr:hypothetical protein [Desulfobulbaceae bacterium]